MVDWEAGLRGKGPSELKAPPSWARTRVRSVLWVREGEAGLTSKGLLHDEVHAADSG